jgi:hypothetical protein
MVSIHHISVVVIEYRFRTAFCRELNVNNYLKLSYFRCDRTNALLETKSFVLILLSGIDYHGISDETYSICFDDAFLNPCKESSMSKKSRSRISNVPEESPAKLVWIVSKLYRTS